MAKRGRKKTMEEPKRISTVLSSNQYRFLEIMTYRMSNNEKKKITLSDLLRRAVETCYPLPNEDQIELFETLN